MERVSDAQRQQEMEPTVQVQGESTTAQSVQPEKKEKPVSLARVYAIVILGMVIGSFTTTLTKVAMNMGVNGTAVTFYRMAIVVVCLAPVCFFNPKYRNEMKHAFSDKKTTLMLLALGVCKLIGILFAAYGVKFVPVLVYNTIWQFNPVFVILLAYFFLKERISKRSLIGVGICLLGVVTVGSGEILRTLGTESSSGMIFGVSIALVSAFSYAIYLIINRMLRQGFSLPTLMFVLFSIALVMDFGVCLASDVPLTMPVKALPLMFVLAMCCTLLSQSLPVWSMKYISPSTYSLLNLLTVLLSAINAYMLLGEVPTLTTAIGACAVVVGLAIYIKTKGRNA